MAAMHLSSAAYGASSIFGYGAVTTKLHCVEKKNITLFSSITPAFLVNFYTNETRMNTLY